MHAEMANAFLEHRNAPLAKKRSVALSNHQCRLQLVAQNCCVEKQAWCENERSVERLAVITRVYITIADYVESIAAISRASTEPLCCEYCLLGRKKAHWVHTVFRLFSFEN